MRRAERALREDTVVWPALEALCPPGPVYELVAPATEGRRRWLIPLDADPRVRWSSLRLYTGTKWSGRVYRLAARAWVTAGGAVLARRTVAGATTGWPLGDLLRTHVPGLATAALYLSPGFNRKVVLQLMSTRGDVLGYAKYSETQPSRALLLGEASLLRLLPEGVAPRPLLVTPFLDGDLTVQTAVPGRARVPRSPEVLAAHRRFLTRLVRRHETHTVSNHPFLLELCDRAGRRRPDVERTMGRLPDVQWPAAYMHGDLTPWNTRYRSGTLRALDWEYGSEAGMAFVEAPHGLIEVAGVIRGTAPARARRAVTEKLRTRLLPEAYQSYASQIATLCALTMLVSWYPEPTPADDFSRWLAAFVAAED